jgi:hypothetical protein
MKISKDFIISLVQPISVQLYQFAAQSEIYKKQYRLLTQADDLLRLQLHIVGSRFLFFFTNLIF